MVKAQIVFWVLFGSSFAIGCLGLVWFFFSESVFLLMLSSTWLETNVLLASATRFTPAFLTPTLNQLLSEEAPCL